MKRNQRNNKTPNFDEHIEKNGELTLKNIDNFLSGQLAVFIDVRIEIRCFVIEFRF